MRIGELDIILFNEPLTEQTAKQYLCIPDFNCGELCAIGNLSCSLVMVLDGVVSHNAQNNLKFVASTQILFPFLQAEVKLEQSADHLEIACEATGQSMETLHQIADRQKCIGQGGLIANNIIIVLKHND